MTEPLHQHDPIDRFTGLALGYALHRPEHAPEAVDFIIRRAGLDAQSLVIDVGSGTGISSRLFARRGLRVVGIEPNDEMRLRAEAEPLPAPLPLPSYRVGRAEATGLPDAVASLVLAAQAFHWFEPDNALREFHRLLKRSGWVALMWYERDETDACTADFAAVVRGLPDASRVEGSRQRAGEVLLTCPLYCAVEKAVFAHCQQLDREGFLGRAFSVSYAPREPAAVAVFAAALGEVFDRHQQEGHVRLHYETTVYLARRKD